MKLTFNLIPAWSKLIRNIPILILFSYPATGNSQGAFNTSASLSLVKRIVPLHYQSFIVESLPLIKKDTFEIESKGNRIILRGSTGVAVASALYCYLTSFCHCQITWNGRNMKLPAILPLLKNKVSKSSPFEYRYYLNYCTFNYSMAWWDWKRWEQEIDWMALHGINMPLAITGEEYTWYKLYKEMGFSDGELKSFFSGPAYFAWFWMGNLDGWGGPLPLHWMKSHYELQKKILRRERELGMKPVLPAFTGHVPSSFKEKYPHAVLKKTNWHNGFADTYILEPSDTLFTMIGKRFLEKQAGLLGTDHLYSADTFNENEPTSDDPAFLSNLSRRIYECMKEADSGAIWIMQGWLFYSDRKFWKSKQIEALLSPVPDEKMIILDLAAEIEPVWKRTEAFFGKKWIWNMLHNFGGNISLFGRMEVVARGPIEALQSPNSGKLSGIGLTMEGIEQNPVLYELMMDHTWSSQPVSPDQWLPLYIQSRYGNVNEKLVHAWQVLRNTVYNGQRIRDGAESIITGRPTFDSTTTWTRTALNYEPQQLIPAWDDLMEASQLCKRSDGFQYDIVDVTRQVLANYGDMVHREFVEAYRNKDLKLFKKTSKIFLAIIDDMDDLLGTRKDFLLGSWISDARHWGIERNEKNLYEKNARDLITLWGDMKSPLHEYSCRQWNGLLKGFYKKRWQLFFSLLVQHVNTGSVWNKEEFENKIRQWEWSWVNSHERYAIKTIGNPVEVSKKLYQKYRHNPDISNF